MDSIQLEEIRENSFLVRVNASIVGAVWKAPSPYRDWYFGRVTIDGQHDNEFYNLEGYGIENSKQMAVMQCANMKPNIAMCRFPKK